VSPPRLTRAHACLPAAPCNAGRRGEQLQWQQPVAASVAESSAEITAWRPLETLISMSSHLHVGCVALSRNDKYVFIGSQDQTVG
jgi:hypothetical protein